MTLLDDSTDYIPLIARVRRDPNVSNGPSTMQQDHEPEIYSESRMKEGELNDEIRQRIVQHHLYNPNASSRVL